MRPNPQRKTTPRLEISRDALAANHPPTADIGWPSSICQSTSPRKSTASTSASQRQSSLTLTANAEPSPYFEKTSKQRHQHCFEEPFNILVKPTSTIIIIIKPVLLPTTLSVVPKTLNPHTPFSFFSCPSAFCLLKIASVHA